MLAPFKHSLYMSGITEDPWKGHSLSPWVWLVVTGVLEVSISSDVAILKRTHSHLGYVDDLGVIARLNSTTGADGVNIPGNTGRISD